MRWLQMKKYDKIIDYIIDQSDRYDIKNLQTEEDKKEDKVIFGGRLAEYKYYDMAPIIEKVLTFKI